MYLPNSIATLVTDFLTNIQHWRYTVSGTAIINTVHTAAGAATTITDVQYNNYTKYTAWRYPVYLQHHALSS
jgi:hypothetical protein